jgi:hypothetical protein
MDSVASWSSFAFPIYIFFLRPTYQRSKIVSISKYGGSCNQEIPGCGGPFWTEVGRLFIFGKKHFET